MIIKGEVLRDDRHAADYRDFRSLTTVATRFHPRAETSQDELVSFTVDKLIITSGFVPIDLEKQRLFMHHTYARIETLNQLRFDIADSRFTYAVSSPKSHLGPCAILGGSIDGNWYHWMLNWCMRLILFRRLRPDLLEDDRVRIVVDSAVLKQPYRAVLDAFGIPEHRLLPIDRHIDHRFENATLASFCDDQKLYPELIREFSSHLLPGLGVTPQPGGRRIFASRQGLPAPKRRIHNFADLEPVLAAHGFDILHLGEMSARDQAQMFHDAELVVGAHGSDLTNIVFCRPRTRVLVFENRGNLTRGLHLALKSLAELMDLDYTYVLLPSAPLPPSMMHDRLAFFHADYIIDPVGFSAQVTDALLGQRERWTSGTTDADGLLSGSRHGGPPQTLQDSYQEPMDWMPLLFVPDTARRDGSDILSKNGSAGYFTDGPYEMLEAGDYRIRITLGRENGDPRPLGFDVFCEAAIGDRIIGTKGLKLTRRQNEHVLVLRVPSPATTDMGLFSLRMRTLDPVEVRLSSLEVERLARLPGPTLDIEKGFIVPCDDADWLPCMEVHEIGYHDGTDRCSRDHRPGYFLDGPHELLVEGDYRFAVTLGLIHDAPRSGPHDVVAEAVVGGRVIASVPLTLTALQATHTIAVRLPAYGDDGTEWFALRLKTIRGSAVRVTRLRAWSKPHRFGTDTTDRFEAKRFPLRSGPMGRLRVAVGRLITPVLRKADRAR